MSDIARLCIPDGDWRYFSGSYNTTHLHLKKDTVMVKVDNCDDDSKYATGSIVEVKKSVLDCPGIQFRAGRSYLIDFGSKTGWHACSKVKKRCTGAIRVVPRVFGGNGKMGDWEWELKRGKAPPRALFVFNDNLHQHVNRLLLKCMPIVVLRFKFRCAAIQKVSGRADHAAKFGSLMVRYRQISSRNTDVVEKLFEARITLPKPYPSATARFSS